MSMSNLSLCAHKGRFDINLVTSVHTAIASFNLLYICEQKHMLLFRKSKSVLFKVSITIMPHIFFRNKTFLFFKIKSRNFQHLIDFEFLDSSQNFSPFRQLLLFGAHVFKNLKVAGNHPNI